nr:reverse transcriptase domain-containing protein [Tanacetum cinerariifolium]
IDLGLRSTSGIRACALRNFDLEETIFIQQEKMELETTQTRTTAKQPILKQESGNSFVPVTQTTTAEGGVITTTISSLITVEEKNKKKTDVKARSMILLALPNEHLMTFNRYKDVESLFAAIETRFSGKEATKKTQKTLLKKMYENFSATSTKSFDSIFNRLQKIVSQLAIMETPPKAMVAIDGVGFDWSYMAKDEAPTNMALMAFSDYEFESYGPKSSEIESKNASKDIPNELKEYPDAPLVKDRVSDNKDCSFESPVVVEKKIVVPTIGKVKVVRPKQQEKPVRKIVRERVVSRNNYTRMNYNNSTRKTHPNAHMNMAPRAVLMKTSLRPLNTARPVNTAHPKPTVYYARPMLRFYKSAQSTHCMMAIFHDMIERTMEVFMDDFLVFGNSFSTCLTNIENMLKRCEDTKLALNWEKSHFMVKEGIVLGHKISKKMIKFDKAKIEVISKLPHPTTVKGIRSFLGHAGFYRRFIKDFSKISRPMTHLLEKNSPFIFSNECIQTFRTVTPLFIKKT